MATRFKFTNGLVSGILAVGLSVSAATVGVLATATPAFAQTTLSVAQISAIQSSLQAALVTATTDTAKQAAIAQALQSAVAVYGSDAAGVIAAVVLQTATSSGLSEAVIGAGIAQGSATIAGSNVSAANAIAATVANEATTGVRLAYQSTSISLGFANLASISAQGPVVTGGITGGTGGQGGIGLGATGGGATGGGAAGGGGGCLNPSCTKL